MNLSYPEINLLEAIEKCHEEVAEDGPRSYSGLDEVIDHLDDPPLEKDHGRIVKALKNLKSKGFVEFVRGDQVKLTESGIAALHAM